MKIRFLVSVAGSPVHYEPGQIVDLPEAIALGWLKGDRAELVEGLPAAPLVVPEAGNVEAAEVGALKEQAAEIETAEAAPAPEVAVVRRGRPRRLPNRDS
jgi:hypothetical protein